MSEYRYLEDIWERGEDIFENVYFTSRGCSKTYYITSTINSSASEMLQKRYVEMKANKQLPTKIIDRHAMSEEGLRDAFLSYNKCEEYIRRICEAYWDMYNYYIDGKKVTTKEFFEYARKIKISDAYNYRLIEKGNEVWAIAPYQNKREL